MAGCGPLAIQLHSKYRCTPQASFFPENECRILLLGKTGAGKSTTGNNILGLNPKIQSDVNKGFAVAKNAFTSVTRTCDRKQGMRGDLTISVTDSPGLEDTARKKEEIYQDIATTLTFVNPGPHVILLVYKFERFTDRDFKNYTAFKQLLGNNIINYIIVIFTHVESLKNGDDDLCETLEKEIMENSPANLLSLLNETGMRYFPFNNNEEGDRMKQQVDKLFQMIFQLVYSNKGSYFECIYTKSINKQLKEMIAEEMMSPENREAKRKEEELQSKMKELEMTKQRELEVKAQEDRKELEKLTIQFGQAVLNLQRRQMNQEKEFMKLLLEEIRQGRKSPPKITLTQEKVPCNLM